MARRRAVGLLAALMLSGCSGNTPAVNDPEAAREDIHQRLAGVWRVTSYIPEQTLSPALLFSMQADKILVRFERGRVSSASSGLTFDRAYRIEGAQASSFTIFIVDENGVEYESRAVFDESESIQFQTLTPPWTGRGVLQREGPAMGRPMGTPLR